MNTKMKALSLALMAVSGLALAGTAAAACPAGPTVAEGGAWAGKTTTQGTIAITTPGYDGTECRMDAALNAGSGSFAAATVRDDTPSDEARYRAQFLVDADAVTNLGVFEAVQIFSAQAGASHQGSTHLVRLSISGAGANKKMNVLVANENSGSNVTATSVPLGAGVNRVEFDLQVGSNGSIDFWVNNGVEGTPSASVSDIDNAGWVGVNRAVLGLAAANNTFRTNHGGKVVSFDEFDSRRVSFIGE